MSNTYDVGNVAVLTGSFIDPTGAPVAPATVDLKIKDPTGTITTVTPTNPETGVYTYNLDLTIPGTYFYRFEGTGGATAAGDSSLTVTPSPVLGCC